MTFAEAIMNALGLVPAKRKPSRVWMHCPFHASRRPTTFSIIIAGERAGNFHCWACGAHGGLVKLVMHVRGLDAEDAKEFVRTLGKTVKPEVRMCSVVKAPPNIGRVRFAMPGEVIIKPVAEWSTTPQQYILTDRKVPSEEVDFFGLGYAVDGTLAGRIIFPARAPDGRALTYSARTFIDEEPKYLTPSTFEHPDLDAFFGANLWGADNPELDDTIAITEGAINAMAVRRASGLNVGAIGGSDVRTGHILTLASRFKRFVIITDPDGPGDKAARMFEAMLGRHGELLRVRLSAGEDAASTPHGELEERIGRVLNAA